MPLSRRLIVGVSRNQPRSATQDWQGALARGIEAGLGSEVSVEVTADYDQLLQKTISSAVDAAWLPPLLHARAAQESARLVALPQRGGWLTFRSALLVRKEDQTRDVGSLRGARAAWRDRNSASGYLFPRLELAAKGAPPEKAFSSEKFYGSVSEAAEAVVRGEADVCTCFVTDPAAGDPSRARVEIEQTLGPLAQSLRILHVTDPIPPDGFVVAPGISDAERGLVTAALLDLHKSEAGRRALADVLQAERLAPVNDALLRSLRSWSAAAAARA